MNKDPGTRRDFAGSRPSDDEARTRREATDDNQGPTNIGTWRVGESSPPRVSRIQLPAELTANYRIIRHLADGGEGLLVRVIGPNDEELVVKLYRAGLDFDETASILLAGASNQHVVEVLKRDVASDDGSRFEVMEWCRFGSLVDISATGKIPVDLTDVVRQLSEALGHIHGLRSEAYPDARLVHQDLKPANVLVRTDVPLKLVLGDFGLARLIHGSVHYTKRQQGSRPYAPPSGEAVSPAWDWWSLGITIAELAGGRHPFEVDGELLRDEVISSLLSQGPVDLSSVSDPRIALLCRGLLARRIADRWGPDEVRLWLSGGTPPVASDAGHVGVPSLRRKANFAGEDFSDPEALALSFQRHWDEAFELVGQRGDRNLVQDVDLLLADWGLEAARTVLSDTTMLVPTRFAKLLVEMCPGLPPRFGNLDVRPQALARLLKSSATAETFDAFDKVLTNGILSVWRGLPGMEGAATAERRARAARNVIDDRDGAPAAAFAQLEKKTHPALKAGLYSLALQGDSSEWSQQLRGLVPLGNMPGWWRALLDAPDDPYRQMLALLTQSHAESEARIADETARTNRQRAAEADRRRAAIEAARSKLQRLPTRQHGLEALVAAIAFGYILSAPARTLIDRFDVDQFVERHSNFHGIATHRGLPYIAGAAVALVGWLLMVTFRSARMRTRRRLTALIAPEAAPVPEVARRYHNRRAAIAALMTLAIGGVARHNAGGSFSPALGYAHWAWVRPLLKPLFGIESKLGVGIIATALIAAWPVRRLARPASSVAGVVLLAMAWRDYHFPLLFNEGQTVSVGLGRSTSTVVAGYGGYLVAGVLLLHAARRPRRVYRRV